MAAVLEAANASVVTDDETDAKYGEPVLEPGLMHHKFCVIDNSKLITGSYNPTDNGERNANALLIIESPLLARNYAREQHSLATSIRREAVRHAIFLNGERVENYFCPGDGCEQAVLRTLRGAKEEILFLAYSFTSDPIGKLLREKKASGVTVKGVCDPTQLNDYTECPGVGALTWQGEGLMHHKTFIVDRSIVITGSYNPTSNADRRNRENLLIIHDPNLAATFLSEFDRLVAQSALQ
jgi:phosphatidylserine/phosphatidylglycerophosphate/cardiolipin synthase-like enzyme